MHRSTLWLSAVCGLSALASCETRWYSTWMLDSIVSRKQGVIASGETSSTLESGFLALAIEATVAQYPDVQDRYASYLGQVLDLASPNLTNVTYAATRPLDRFSVARAVDRASTAGIVSISAVAASAHDAINASLTIQNRNPDGGLWYYVYPQWSYMDGMFSVLPYMASLPQPNYTDIELQVSLLYDHCLQKNTSLVVHGYDYSRTAVWADKETGASPYVWSRAVGWFVAGLVQTWETLDCAAGGDGAKASACGKIQNITTQLSTSLVRHADPETGTWWQMAAYPGREGNYLESSATALFAWSFLRGERIGIFTPGCDVDFKKAALKAYEYTVNNFVTKTDNDTIGYDKTVAVCSLNSTATYEYYVQRPLFPNSLLGESAFIMASLEVERE
ncbi:glycosyl hydrolase family 88 [Colletotrichum plurivorum]|uniref:Glycosyl hydrolase family 88 n=1 Tax=Colletotrichum plurivorum TaxID=2175906 RepID=A0A8H6JJS5_9PEZI|nr:glycosyl hydrolase family 88 [Colletotrichum plurivorum]